MDVRMVSHGRSPGVKHGGDTDPGTQMLSIGGDGRHCLRRGPEQQIIDRRFVLPGDGGDLGRNAEHDVEIADR